MKRNRRKARQYAFQYLYAHDVSADTNSIQIPEGETSQSMDAVYANKIIDGVLAHVEEIDSALEPFCQKKAFKRMDKVDRAILRVAVWELTYNDETLDASIIINEAIQLGKDYGADSSYKLINALLDNYYKSIQ